MTYNFPMGPIQAHHRIVVTGGPGGGKTTASDLFRRELGECVAIVPETATILFQGGFPRSDDPQIIEYVQRTIYHVQKNNEDLHATLYPNRTLLCDRGTIDGAAYWPGDSEKFFIHMGTTLDDELRRYEGVIFFETAASGQMQIEGGNPHRVESLEQAVELDKKLRKMYENHPNFVFIAHEESFFQKITKGFNALEAMVNQLNN